MISNTKLKVFCSKKENKKLIEKNNNIKKYTIQLESNEINLNEFVKKLVNCI